MTNEEKIKHIYNITYNQAIEDGIPEKIAIMCAIMCKTSAEIMDKWKDEQYAKALAPILIELDELKHQVKSLLP